MKTLGTKDGQKFAWIAQIRLGVWFAFSQKFNLSHSIWQINFYIRLFIQIISGHVRIIYLTSSNSWNCLEKGSLIRTMQQSVHHAFFPSSLEKLLWNICLICPRLTPPLGSCTCFISSPHCNQIAPKRQINGWTEYQTIKLFETTSKSICLALSSD